MDLSMIQKFSEEVFDFWENRVRGWAPKDVVSKLEVVKLDWLEDLTKSLTIWKDIGVDMTEGELILAYVNLGSLVEGWLKLFYCVYYMDYLKNPEMTFKGKIIEPNDLKFEVLKQFSRDKLWSKNDSYDKWIDKIQLRRNAIHAFNYRDIGNPKEFLEDINYFYSFIRRIDDQLPYPD